MESWPQTEALGEWRIHVDWGGDKARRTRQLRTTQVDRWSLAFRCGLTFVLIVKNVAYTPRDQIIGFLFKPMLGKIGFDTPNIEAEK